MACTETVALEGHAQTRFDESVRKSLLRFLTCGSVDDGKSTLIGRLLYESQLVLEDQFAALERDSRRSGTRGEALDFALLVDGLAAEREQGITIDVAYRYFSTARRSFIVADTPGHEQYTRNMATGASTADVAVLMIDARKGLLTQTRRHAFIAAMLGVRQMVACVNKMDLVCYDAQTFRAIDQTCRGLAGELGLERFLAMPVCAVDGANVVKRSPAMPWYDGPTLLQHLEDVEVDAREQALPLRLPVQWVNRPHADFRGYCGRVESGTLTPGDPVKVMPSGKDASVVRIVGMGGDHASAVAGQSVTLTLDREIDIARGDVIVSAEAPCAVADQFEVRLLWMAQAPMLPGRTYRMKIGAQMLSCTVSTLKAAVDVTSFDRLAATRLDLNDIGMATIELDRPIAFDPYDVDRTMGGFILIDRESHDTVGLGTISFALRRADNIHRQALAIGKKARSVLNGQRPVVLWFTGLSGAGKSTLADAVSQRLHARRRRTMLLDGDNVRHGLSRDLGFTDVDRVENIRRIAEVAKLMVEAGLITLVSFISPFRAERAMARAELEEGEFVEIFVDTPIEVAESRDPKGLYAKARAGDLANFTGIDSPYEPPEAPDLHVRTQEESVEDAAARIIAWLEGRGYLDSQGTRP